VQETLLQAARSVHRFRGESGLYTWLHGILLNVTRTHQRRAARTVYTATPEPTEVVPGEQGRQLDAETTAAAVLAALRQLTPEHREVVVLHY
jgi:RNA polymerase sigma-70 factor (ECF subfamily)